MKRKYIEPVLNVVKFEENALFWMESSPNLTDKEVNTLMDDSIGDSQLDEPGAGDAPTNAAPGSNNSGDDQFEAGPDSSAPSVSDTEPVDSAAPVETTAPEPAQESVPDAAPESAPDPAPVEPEPPVVDPPASEEPSAGM